MANLHVRLLPYANGSVNMATIDMNTGKITNSISERKRLAKLPDDLEIESDILEARQNKKARQDAGMDMLLDAIKKKKKKGKA